MLKRIHGERGLTLVELLVVLAILAILVALIVPNITGLLTGAVQTGMLQERDSVQTAIDVYNTQDVAISAAATIAANNASVYVSVGSNVPTDFGRYVDRTSKYYYHWGAGGVGLSVTNLAASY